MNRTPRRKIIPDSIDEMGSVLTVQDVAEYLHVHRNTVYRLLNREQLPAFKIGSEWRFNRESIDLWRADGEQKLKKAGKRRLSPGK